MLPPTVCCYCRPPWPSSLPAVTVTAVAAAAALAPPCRRPSEALMAGLLLLVAALGCLPLVQRYYPHSQPAKRALLLATALAALLILLRPPLPIRGGAECPRLPMGLCPRLWDKEHVPEHELDDVSVWGEPSSFNVTYVKSFGCKCCAANSVVHKRCVLCFRIPAADMFAPRFHPAAGDGLRRRTHWPLWAMVGAAFLGLSAVTQPSGGAGSALARGAQAAGAAYLMAAYLALEFFPGLPLVQVGWRRAARQSQGRKSS